MMKLTTLALSFMLLGLAPQDKPESELEKATFAGGCFWCMEPPFDKLDGVLSTTSGYTAGHLDNPSYEQVSSGRTGHTDKAGQFCDRGSQYRPGIYYHGEEQKKLAEASKRELGLSGRLPKPVVVEVEAATTFYRAEEYHQDYYQRHGFRYKLYRRGCGRDRVLKRLWGSTD